MSQMTPQALDALAATLSPEQITTNPQELSFYGLDSSKHFESKAEAVVFPRSTEDVHAIVLWANQHRIGLVPSGGRTGLSGGAVALADNVIVSFDKMNAILDVNTVDAQITCEAGVVTQTLQEKAKEHGLFYPVDFASSGSSQIGGNIATNAGGINVIRYGMTRDWVAGLTVVTGKGDILQLNQGLLKNNTGYDLRHLFIGSEGTLGFITEVTMQLTTQHAHRPVLLLGLPNLNHITDIMASFRQHVTLNAFEFFSHQALEKVIARGQVPNPFEEASPFYVLLEFEQHTEKDLDTALQLFETFTEKGWVTDAVLSQNDTQAQQIWRLREDISETLAPFTPYKNDISVKISQVVPFLERIDDLLAEYYPDFEVIWYGHIGDGNLHLNILKPQSMEHDGFMDRCSAVSLLLMGVLQQFNGSVSAEHGIGLLKKDYLGYTRQEEDIAYMQGIKAVFDPLGIMNPGKVLPQQPACF